MNKLASTQIENLLRDERSGVYYVRFRVSQSGEKSWQVLRSLRTKDFAHAKSIYAGVIAEGKAEAEPPGNKNGSLVTVRDAIDAVSKLQFAFKSRGVSAKPRTVEYYEERLRAVLKSWPTLADTKLMELTPAECQSWADSFRAKYSPHTFYMSLVVLRHVFDYAIKNKWATSNPFAGIKHSLVGSEAIPDVPSREIFQEILRLLDSRVHPVAQATNDLVRLLAYSGLRRGEAAGLRWQDVDFKRGLVCVVNQRNRDGHLVIPKNRKKRWVDMNPALRECLLAMFNRAADKSPEARVTQVDSCAGALDYACGVLKIPRLRHQDLRHLFTTRCLEALVDCKTVAEWLGDSDGGVRVAKLYWRTLRNRSPQMAAKVSFTGPVVGNVAEQEPTTISVALQNASLTSGRE